MPNLKFEGFLSASYLEIEHKYLFGKIKNIDFNLHTSGSREFIQFNEMFLILNFISGELLESSIDCNEYRRSLLSKEPLEVQILIRGVI